jgi:PPOX class probable F420-dependent enzyme
MTRRPILTASCRWPRVILKWEPVETTRRRDRMHDRRVRDVTTFPASHLDLLDNAGVASLATLGADGYPQVTAIWFMRVGDTIVTSLTTQRQKYKNAVRHPQVTLFLIDPANPFRTIEIRGDLTTEPDPELETLRAVVAHYGQDFETFPAPKTDRVKVTIVPHRVVANG